MSTPSQKPLTSKPPPPPSGGNLKYVVIGLLLTGAAIALWLMRGKEEPSAPPQAPSQIERVNPLQEPDLDLEPEPEPEPEVEVEEPEPEAVKKPAGRKLGEWECSGDLPGAAGVLNANRAQIRSCYERRLKVNHVLQGDLTLKLKVGATGKVTATQVTGSLRDPEVFSCVRKLAQTWTFQVPSGGSCAVLEVPFQFSPKP